MERSITGDNMQFLFDYMVNGINFKEDFGIERDKAFLDSLTAYMSKKFKGDVVFKQCPINKENYFLVIDSDDFKEIFGFTTEGDNLYFLEGMYLPENLQECVPLLNLLTELIEFCSSYEPEEESESFDLEWL